MTGCPFCARIAAGREVTAANEHAVAFPDGFPLGPGHTLVVPRAHVARLEDADHETWRGVFDLVREVVALVDADGVNVGVNSGAAAGQTVGHAHVHVIPRVAGDVEDPRGGVRWVIPQRAAYWHD